jgi:hypothetical protein
MMRVRTKISELVGYGLETKRLVIGCGRRADRSAPEFGFTVMNFFVQILPSYF